MSEIFKINDFSVDGEVAKCVGLISSHDALYLDFEQATALCEAITTHIIAERARMAAEEAKSDWEMGQETER